MEKINNNILKDIIELSKMTLDELIDIRFLDELIRKYKINRIDIAGCCSMGYNKFANALISEEKISYNEYVSLIIYFKEYGYEEIVESMYEYFLTNTMNNKYKNIADKKDVVNKDEDIDDKDKEIINIKEKMEEHQLTEDMETKVSSFDSFNIINGKLIIEELVLRHYPKDDIIIATLIFGNTYDKIKLLSKVLKIEESYIINFYKNCISLYQEILNSHIETEKRYINSKLAESNSDNLDQN